MSLANKSLTLYPPVSSKYGVSYSHEAPITIGSINTYCTLRNCKNYQKRFI